MPHPFPQKSKNLEERRAAKLRTEKVSLEAGLGRPHDGGWSKPGPYHQDDRILWEEGGREGGRLDQFCQLRKTVLVLNLSSFSFPATSHHTVLIKMVFSIPEMMREDPCGYDQSGGHFKENQ